MKDSKQVTIVLGRVLLAAIFIFSGLGSLTDFTDTIAFMNSKGMPAAPLFLLGAIFLNLVGGFSLLLGYRTHVGATLLIVFLLPATFIFHNFWSLEGAEKQLQMVMFMKNLAIIGGVLYVSAFGPGEYSLDKKSEEELENEQNDPPTLGA